MYISNRFDIDDRSFKLNPAHVRQERVAPLTTLLKKGKRRTGRFNPLARGAGIFYLPYRRNQRCIIKASYTKNTSTRSWAAHGEYLQREHAQSAGEKGLGFSSTDNSIDLKTTLRQWQKANDEHVFKLIISPENGHQMDLKRHAKELILQMEKDLKTKLEWAAIDHHNTDHPHLHLLIRGRDNKKQTLVIDSDYISRTMRHRSEELATRELGLRRENDIALTRENQIERTNLTAIDRSLRRKSENSIVNYHTPVSDNLMARAHRLLEIKRLKFLERLGLAEKVTKKSWKLGDELESTLLRIQLSNDIIKSRANHHIPTLFHEELAPTIVQENKPLTGKVIGMGLEDELKDRRYLLLEGTDGKTHYIQATNSIIKARDTEQFHNENVITLEKKKFTNEHGKTIEHMKVQNHLDLKELQLDPESRLDRDVIQFVHHHKMKPNLEFPERCFAAEYAQAMTKRFNALKQEKIL